MSEANKIQIGGEHYKGLTVEHWDFVAMLGLNYFEGCATKYLMREKNGAEDVEKAMHYLQKAEELKLQSWYWRQNPTYPSVDRRLIRKRGLLNLDTTVRVFLQQFEDWRARCIDAVLYSEPGQAARTIRSIIHHDMCAKAALKL